MNVSYVNPEELLRLYSIDKNPLLVINIWSGNEEIVYETFCEIGNLLEMVFPFEEDTDKAMTGYIILEFNNLESAVDAFDKLDNQLYLVDALVLDNGVVVKQSIDDGFE
jgi:hypothetical protein